MIVFDLKCHEGHQFESWFRSSGDYADQQDRGLVTCPLCGSPDVKKAIMAPNVSAKSNQKIVSAPARQQAQPASQQMVAHPQSKAASGTLSPEMKALQSKVAEMAKAVRDYAEAHCDNVGDKFAEEARKIHYGETEERGIYGNATLEEAHELLEEGIDLLPIPGARRADA